MIEVIHCIIKPKLLDSHSKMSFDHFMKKNYLMRNNNVIY